MLIVTVDGVLAVLTLAAMSEMSASDSAAAAANKLAKNRSSEVCYIFISSRITVSIVRSSSTLKDMIEASVQELVWQPDSLDISALKDSAIHRTSVSQASRMIWRVRCRTCAWPR